MNETQRPRILFEAVPPELLESLQRFGPVTGTIQRGMDEVHPSDWDLVVSFAAEPIGIYGVPVLSFGGARFMMGDSHGYHALSRTSGYARSVQKARACPEIFASLVDRTIVETSPPPPRGLLSSRPFLEAVSLATVGAENAPYAALLKAANGKLALALPGHTTDHAGWLSAFIRYLRDDDPARYPADPDWQRSSDWGTPEVRVALRELEAVEAERSAMLDRLATRESAATTRLDQALHPEAAGGARLLTEDGDELVAGVLQVLTDLGFIAVDRDDHHDQKTGAKLEDLLVTEGDWCCLVEVKGYTKGAKVSDVPQIVGRPVVAFVLEHGREPDAVWHIVNGWRKSDPAMRAPAIPNDLDLTPLTCAAGCLIDTRDLFRAWRDVREQRATADDVRASLRGASTRWTWVSPQ